MSSPPHLRATGARNGRTARLAILALLIAGGIAALFVHRENPPTSPRLASTMQLAPAVSPGLRLYLNDAQPIFQANCYRCHAGLNHRGGFRMDSQAGMLHGGRDGVVVVPGHPEQSLLIKLIRHEGPPNDPMPMPPKGKLSDADIATITRWVQAGALMPAPSPD